MGRAGIFVILLAAAAGCGTLDLEHEGHLHFAREDVADDAGAFDFDGLGNPRFEGQLLRLPSAREPRRFGIAVVDVGAAPAAWRPPEAKEGGIVVASLARASPFAAAGLRPYDVIEAVNGTPPSSVEEVALALREAPPGGPVELEVRRGTPGERFTVAAEPAENVLDSSQVWIPFLFERRTATERGSVGLGPWDALFWYRDTYVNARRNGRSVEHGWFEERSWGALFNLVSFERAEPVPHLDGASPEPSARLRILWFIRISV
jgi:hypothetical protein